MHSGHSMKEYETLNSSAERFAKNYSYMLIACLVSYIFAPIAVISYHLLMGTYTDELLKLPLEAMYVDNDQKFIEFPCNNNNFKFFLFHIYVDILSIILKCLHLCTHLLQVQFRFSF